METKIAKQLEGAEREQRNIYMQLVPKVLPEITPKKMVQAKDAEEALARPEEWFADIVPDKVTRNLSKYASNVLKALPACLLLYITIAVVACVWGR